MILATNNKGKLKELREVTLPEMQAKAKESGDQTDVQAVHDMENMIKAL